MPPLPQESNVITVWPCDHGGVRVEGPSVPFGHVCATCGVHPVRYVRSGALTSDAAVNAAAEELTRRGGGRRVDRDNLRVALNAVRGLVNAGGV